MSKFSLKSILEEEDKKLDEASDEKELDNKDDNDEDLEREAGADKKDKKVDESEDDDKEKVDESDDEEKTDEDFKAVLPKPGKLRTEAKLGEPKDADSKIDTEGKPGETRQAEKGIEKEKKPGETKQASVSESEEDEDEVKKIEEEDDEDLLLVEEEDKDKVDESGDEIEVKDKVKVKEAEDEIEVKDKVEESDDEDEVEVKVDEAVVERMLKALNVTEAEMATFKDILRGAIVESVRHTTKKAVKKARKHIVSEANTRIREGIKRKKESIRKLNEISARSYERFEEAHKEELKKLDQYDEMVNLFKSMNGVMESFGIAQAPANKRLQKELEASRKAHAKEVASLKLENAELKTEGERAKIRSSLDKMTKTMTESEKAEFISIVSEMKVEGHSDFVKRATKVRDRLYKEDKSGYENFVEKFTESVDIVRKPTQVTEGKEPRNIMEAVTDTLSGL